MNRIVLTLLAICLCVTTAAGQEPTAEKKRKPKYTISKATTFVTGPVDDAGYIDYAAALNARLKGDATPKNNAVVLLWKTFGPRPEGAVMPDEFYKLLEIDAPPEDGDYFVDLIPWLQKNDGLADGANREPIFKAMDDAGQRPWAAGAHPDIAAWLKAMDKPLARLRQAAACKEYFSPVIPQRSGDESAGLYTALLPGVQKTRSLANALIMRAMLRAGSGQLDDAWEDLIACHRLGRLVARGGTLIEGLVGVAIDTLAGNADLAYFDNAACDARRFRNCLRDLRALPAFPVIGDKVDLTERFMYLETALMIDRHGPIYLERLAGAVSGTEKAPAQKKSSADAIDFDETLRNGNRWFDRIGGVMRIESRADREANLDEIDRNLRALKQQGGGFLDGVKLFTSRNPEKARGKKLGDTLIGLLAPSLRKVLAAHDRVTQLERNLHVACALGAYQRANGHYPKTLDALVPDYVSQLPLDLFSGKALIYRPSEGGYLLYSVGPNGRDDGGRYYDDDPMGDDPRVRMPLPIRKN